MPLRNSVAALRANLNTQSLWSTSSTALSRSFPSPRSTSSGQRHPQPRQYATAYGEERRWNDARCRGNSRHNWPASKTPTPYEIFDVDRSAPYSKSKYYELVKLYHPDRKHHTSYDGLPYAIRLERYRLVVAANDILRDAAKRRAYDLFGAGWASQAEQPISHREADFSWRQEPGNAANNATWEDWERWYQARDGKRPEPQYMSNGAFVLVIALFVLLGGWGQGVRAGNRNMSAIELRDQQNTAIHGELRRRQNQTATLSREGRVESFLRQREGWDSVSTDRGKSADSVPK